MSEPPSRSGRQSYQRGGMLQIALSAANRATLPGSMTISVTRGGGITRDTAGLQCDHRTALEKTWTSPYARRPTGSDKLVHVMKWSTLLLTAALAARAQVRIVIDKPVAPPEW